MWQWGRQAVGFQFEQAELDMFNHQFAMHADLLDVARSVSQSLGMYDAVHIRFRDGSSDPRERIPPPIWFISRIMNVRKNDTLIKSLETPFGKH
mmetsp:Transcript_9392/g.12265  ORF Transcript_9392/g.12265 Transcript_9392/m.12265 type:complete len:94 (-) Transcript_9392:315-596(-)